MKIFWTVTALHLLALALFSLPRKQQAPPPPKLLVHTVQLQPKKVEPIAVAPQEKPAQKKEPTAAKKPTPKPAPEKKAAKPSPQPEKKATSHAQLRKLLEEGMATLDEKRPQQVAVEAPQKVGKLKSEALSFSSYETELVAYLRELLELPEEGEVKLQLTLSRAGAVVAHQVIDASDANRRYIDQEIGHLRLPPFETHFKGEKEHTFPLLLKSS